MEQRSRIGSRLYGVATDKEGLSLDPTQAPKNIEVRRYLEFHAD